MQLPFQKIESPFLEAVKMTLGDRYTDNMDQIYKLTIKFVIETVVKGYEMAAEREVMENVRQLNSISNRPYYEDSAATSKEAKCPVSAASGGGGGATSYGAGGGAGSGPPPNAGGGDAGGSGGGGLS